MMAKPKENPWPWFVGTLVFFFVTALASTLFYALRTGIHLVDADYYEKGRTYEQSARKGRNALKREMKARYQQTARGLVVTVTDKGSRPVNGADVRFVPTAPDGTEPLQLREDSPGSYLLPAGRLGRDSSGCIVVTADDSVLTERIRVMTQ